MNTKKENNPVQEEEKLFDRIEMTDEQQELHDSLTLLQRNFSINIINGMTKKQAYFNAGGKAKSDGAVRLSIHQIITKHNVSEYLKQMKAVAAGIQLLTSADVAEALMREAGILRDIKGNLIPPPEDSKQSARIAAISKLTDYTGDFDKNKNKVEHSGYVDRAESDLYDN